jgi:hypothetical protein
MDGVPLPDLTALSNLRVAAIRSMTENPALTDRCDSCLRDRGIGRIRLFFTSLFAMLGAGGWAFLCCDWDDEDVPTQRLLVWTGAIVIALIAAYFGSLAFVFI